MCLQDPWRVLRVPERGQSHAQGREFGVCLAPRCLALLLGASWSLPTLLPVCPCLWPSPRAPLIYLSRTNPEPWASSRGGSRASPAFPAAVPECGESAQPCFCKVLRCTFPSASLPLSLSLSSLFFCRMLQGKENLWKRFQELFCLPWCQSVHAPGWLSPPFPLPGSTPPSPRTKDRSCYPSLAASRAPAPGAAECILERARYMQLPVPPLKDKIPFPHSHPGKNVNFKFFPRQKSK